MEPLNPGTLSRELRDLRGRLYNRIPLIGGWLRRRAAQELARNGTPGAVQVLAEALIRSDDKQVRDLALERLRCLTAPPQVDALCAVWAKTRHPTLEKIVVEGGLAASKPADLKVLVALKAGRIEPLTDGGGEVVEPLAQALEDADRDIAGGAKLALERLKKTEAKEALCRLLIEREHPTARDIALTAGYVPRDEHRRALFFFLTEQWERYETLDFDRRLLRTAYDAADAALRQRLTEKLRKAGRTDFLTVLVGGDYRSRAAEMTPREADLLLQVMEASDEWAKLWPLAFELPFHWSQQIVKAISGKGWRPEPEDEQALFRELEALALAGMVEDEKEMPPALLRARARVPGRINDVAFSPTGPIIAIGTGRQRVGLWDFQRGEMQRILNRFARSVGQVVFTHNGTLVCAERTNSDSPCAVYAWRDGQSDGVYLGQHDASVTAVEPLDDSQVLTAGRDHMVTVWDITGRGKVREKKVEDWARAARISPNGQQAALLHRGVTLMDLSQMKVLAQMPDSGVSRCVDFAPDGDKLILGKFNGEVVLCERKGQRLRKANAIFARHEGQVQGVEMLPDRPVVVTAGSEGLVRFTSWEDGTLLDSIQVPGKRLTSLKVSPDGAFMAVGDSDASTSLWDLRATGIFSRPLARSSPADLSIARTLSADGSQPPKIQRSLRFIEKVLHHRFQYEIEIGEAPTIKVGEFDIEIE